MLNKSIMPLTVGILAGFLVLLDWLIAPLIYMGGNFVWVAFVSWTIFFGFTLKDRYKAIPSLLIGFIAANLIVYIANNLGMPSVIPAILATFTVNFLIMYLVHVKFLVIPGIFFGIAMTFARGGVGLDMWSLNIIILILIYGILGLICGYVCTLVQSRKENT